MRSLLKGAVALSATILFTSVSAKSLGITDTASIQSTAATLLKPLLTYPSSGTGQLPAPYYWWEAGGMWGGVLDYWHYTNDGTYNGDIISALAANAGTGSDFMGSYTDGNDDQGWWALSAMSAAEYGLPAAAGCAAWLDMAKNVWNEMNGRWDTSVCNGGLKWKIAPGADGWHYKNSVSNGLFFQLSARLYKLTGDAQYASMAGTIFSWVQSVGLIDKTTWAVYDGTDDTIACSRVDHDEWSYNVGLFLYGSAVMQAMPNADAVWAQRTAGLMGATEHFFVNGVLQETKCEPEGSCDVDQLSFKAFLARYMAATAVVLPAMQAQIVPLLQSSAAGATVSCGAGPGSNTCGMRWTTGGWDGTQGVGQQLAALEVVHGLLATGQALPAPAPKAAKSVAARESTETRRRRLSEMRRA